MTSRYQVRIYDHAGVTQHVITNWRNLEVEQKLNDIDTCTLSIDLKSTPIDISTIQRDYLVQVLRSNPANDIDWREEFFGFHRTPQRQRTVGNNRIYTSYARGRNDLLKRRHIAYLSGTAGGEKSGPADDVMKAFVRENCGGVTVSPATSVSVGGTRLRNASTLMTIAPNNSAAPTWEGARQFRNVLAVLQEIGQQHGVDFEVTQVSLNPPAFTFVTYYPQRGTLRTVGNGVNPPVIFSTGFANADDISFTVSATEQVTAVVSLGVGLEVDRSYAVVEAAIINESPWSDIELIKDARNQNTAAALTNEAQETLQENSAQESFRFKGLQTSQFQYGRDYFLGDTVTVQFDEIRRDLRLVGVRMKSSGGEDTIDLEFGEYRSRPVDMIDVFTRWVQNVQELKYESDT